MTIDTAAHLHIALISVHLNTLYKRNYKPHYNDKLNSAEINAVAPRVITKKATFYFSLPRRSVALKAQELSSYAAEKNQRRRVSKLFKRTKKRSAAHTI